MAWKYSEPILKGKDKKENKKGKHNVNKHMNNLFSTEIYNVSTAY